MEKISSFLQHTVYIYGRRIEGDLKKESIEYEARICQSSGDHTGYACG